MRKFQSSALMLAMLLTLGFSSGIASAQPAASQPASGSETGGRGRGGMVSGMLERFGNGIKEQMGASDDEWKIIEPRIQKVIALQMDGGGMGGMMGIMGMLGGGRGRRGGGDAGGQGSSPGIVVGGTDLAKTDVAKASAELRAAVTAKDAKPDDVKAKLTALRAAREKAKAELGKAQKELREILNVQQEGLMVVMGLLD